MERITQDKLTLNEKKYDTRRWRTILFFNNYLT